MRLLWTWDHSTNWVLDASGQVDYGCFNRYRKPPDTFVEDYGRLAEHAAAIGANGIIVWGLLRDAHGGVDGAHAVIDRAAAHGVRILAAIGTSSYGGFYYDGNHPFNVDTRLAANPEVAARDRLGNPLPRLCPSHPDNLAWLREGTRWLLGTLDLGGLNIENGDFVLCSCARCGQARADLPGDDPDVFKEMQLSIAPVIEEAIAARPDIWTTWATYTGFERRSLPPELGVDVPQDVAGHGPITMSGVGTPAIVAGLPEQAIAQWTLTGMLRREPAFLSELMDDPAAAALPTSDMWPRDLRPTSARSIGYAHQGSQWHRRHRPVDSLYGLRDGDTRYGLEIASIKEACVRGVEAGLEGIVIQGEVSSSSTPNELNYLAFGHFTTRPHDTLRAFARITLAPLLGGSDEAELFVTALAESERGPLSPTTRADLTAMLSAQVHSAAGTGDTACYRRWRWLGDVVIGAVGRPFPYRASDERASA